MNINTNKKIIFRADASTQIGTGHVMRCLALAQGWQDNSGDAIFITTMDIPKIEKRIKDQGMEVIRLSVQPGSVDDAVKTAELAKRFDVYWVVIDGYHFGAEYQRIIKDSELNLLKIDDNGDADYYYADIILNQNLHACKELYENRESYTRLLLGTKYVLLRREFLKWIGWKREISAVAKKILVTLGGSDPNNMTHRVIQALKRVGSLGLEVKIVLGPKNISYKKLCDDISNSTFSIQLIHNVIDMSELMAWADIAITSAGSTCWETLFMGLPSILIITADNQLVSAGELLKTQFVYKVFSSDFNIDELTNCLYNFIFNNKARNDLSTNAKNIIDGKGCYRVSKLIAQ